MALSQGATSLPFAPKPHNHISESTATTKPMARQMDKIKSLKIVMPNAVWSAPSAGPAATRSTCDRVGMTSRRGRA
jgi:hypothetical protein